MKVFYIESLKMAELLLTVKDNLYIYIYIFFFLNLYISYRHIYVIA